MAELVRPSAIKASTSRSRPLSPARVSVRREAPISWVTTSGSRAVPPDATRTRASTKSADVCDPVLEQVADPGRAAGQQLGGVAGLDVLGEDQDPHAGMAPAQGEGGPQPFVGEGRRHADVDHGHVGGIFGHRLLEADGIADGAGHGETPVGQKLDQSVAQDGGVLGDHDGYGVGAGHGSRMRGQVDGDGGRAARRGWRC